MRRYILILGVILVSAPISWEVYAESKNINVAQDYKREFTQEDMKLCGIIYGEPPEHAGFPDLFGNVDEIEIGASDGDYGPEQGLSVFKKSNIATYAACRLKRDSSRPVFILKTHQYNPPEASDAGKLILIVMANLSGDSWEENNRSRKERKKFDPVGKPVQVQVIFYRNGVHDLRSQIDFNCAKSFIYPKNSVELEDSMKRAIQFCINDPFWVQ